MKKNIIFLTLLLIGLTSAGQVKIKKSTDIVTMLGRKYYVHTVAAGETLYSLGHIYGVPIDQIILVNKEVIETLNTGTILRIPLIDANYKPSPITKISFIEHTVKNKRKESLYGIAKQYNITQDQIIKYNPQIKNGISKGMKLKIPVTKIQNINATDELFIYHQIKKGETLQLIVSQYNISIDDIKQFNNINEITTGKIISIPKKILSEEQIYLLKYNTENTTDFLNIDPNYFEDPSCPPCNNYKYNDTTTFNVSFLLPLFINQNYGISFNSLMNTDSDIRYFDKTMIFYEYLQGAIIALNELKKDGIKLNINIYDTKADSSTIENLMKIYEIKKSDLIFGPIYSKNYNLVQKFSIENKINIVSPLTTQISTITENPFVFKINPSAEEVTKFYAQYLAKYSDTAAIFAITDHTDKQNALADTLHKFLTIASENYDTIKFKKITFSKFVTPYRKNLSPTKHNFIFIPSTNEVQLSAIFNNLNALINVNNYKITVITLPIVENFTKLQSEWLRNLNIHYATAMQIDKNEIEYKNFADNYKNIFGRNPAKYSFIGYDVTYYFINLLKKYGKYFQFCINDAKEYLSNGMFLKFNFERTNPKSGFENKKLKMLYYSDELEIKNKE